MLKKKEWKNCWENIADILKRAINGLYNGYSDGALYVQHVHDIYL